MAVRIVQYVCPQRHCIMAAAYEEGGSTTGEEAEIMIRAAMTTFGFNGWCGICKSRDLHFEDATTGFSTMKEAAPTLAALQMANLLAKAHYDRNEAGRN